MNNSSKIKSQSQIIQIIQALKKQGKKIVTYNGSFDILHLGHIKAIEESKKQGEVLIILLNSDKSVQSYKGPRRPIIPESERAEMLTALEAVDYVVFFNEINPILVLSKLKPTVHCNGEDWGKDCIEKEVVEENGGKIHILKWEKGKSTTNLIDKILKVYKEPTIRAVFLDRDGVINDNKNGYVHKIEDFEFLPYVLESLKRLSKTDFKIIIVTNQSGIGRNYYSEEDFNNLNNWMLQTLKKEGVKVDRVYYCPHHPEDKCECRKPGIKMLLMAVKDFEISLNNSWMIGNNEEDVIMSRRANLKSIKLDGKMPSLIKLEPNFYAKNFSQAVELILNSKNE